MTIEEFDFKMTPINETSLRFDLELIKTIKPRGGTPRQELSDAGYGLPVKTCIEKIIHHRICTKHIDEKITLETFFKEYIEEHRKVYDILKKYLDV